MPANLTPEYKAAELAFQQAKEPEEKITWLEKMLAVIPKHKGTDHLQADLKRRLSKLKDGLEKKGKQRGFAVTVEREGAAQLAIVGSPNSGKSTLVEAITNAKVEVADYPFSTRSPVPGMLIFEDIQFQLIDLPPVSREYQEPFVTDIIRNSDGVLWVIDAAEPHNETFVQELLEILEEKKIAMVGRDHPDAGRQDRVRWLPALVVASKMDVEGARRGLSWIRRRFEPELGVVALSALGDSQFDELEQAVFHLSKVVRVYSKMPSREADMSRPYILHEGDTVVQFATQVHKDFAEKLKFARVWGKGKFDGQRVTGKFELTDDDVIEFHI